MLSLDYAFLTLLLATSVTGLLLLALRDTSAMGILLREQIESTENDS